MQHLVGELSGSLHLLLPAKVEFGCLSLLTLLVSLYQYKSLSQRGGKKAKDLLFFPLRESSFSLHFRRAPST